MESSRLGIALGVAMQKAGRQLCKSDDRSGGFKS
jgi:hypothetical protein